MDFHEVVIAEIQRDCGFKISQLFAGSIGEPGQEAAVHSQRVILFFDVRRANGALEIQEFKELKNPLVPPKADLEQRIVAPEGSKANRLEPLKNFILEANQAEKRVKEKNWLELESFLKKSG